MRRPFLLGLAVLLLACNRSKPGPEKIGIDKADPATTKAEGPPSFAPVPVHVPESEGSLAPAIGQDGAEVWMSWLSPAPLGGHTLWAAPLADPLLPVKVAEGEHLLANWADVPQILPVGADLVAAYMVQPYELRVTRSSDRGETWSKPVIPHEGTAREFGFPFLFPAGNDVGLAWLQDGSLRVGGVDPAGTVLPPETVDPRTCECCKLDVAVATDGPVIAYRDRSEAELRDIAVVRRRSAGWTEPTSPASDGWTVSGCPVNGPALDARGNDVVMVRFTGKEPPGQVLAALSPDGGATFGSSIRLDEGHPLGRADVVWTESDAIASWMEVDAKDPARARVVARRIHTDLTLGPVTDLGQTVSSRDSGFARIIIQPRTLWWVWTATGPGGMSQIQVAHAALKSLP